MLVECVVLLLCSFFFLRYGLVDSVGLFPSLFCTYTAEMLQRDHLCYEQFSRCYVYVRLLWFEDV